MQITNGITALDIQATIMGKITVIHPTLLVDDNIAILVDTGYPGQTPLIRDAMEKAGVPFKKLRKIIVTHQDIDHIGSLPVILSESLQTVEVLASVLEKPFIQGDEPLLKYTEDAINCKVQSLPTEVAEMLRASFKRLRENPPKAKVDKTVLDEEVLPYCGGIVVIDTPGHTPGHISLYHQRSKTLIAGDAMRVIEGQLQGPDPSATLDMNTAMKSVAKFKQYDIQSVICYHGGRFNDHVNERIAALCQ
jgi:glyoxylase-like metal-dependent hydrolase (beta-lactamase superfamily II)